jgi:capsular polysaccharide biosynthesis protein
MDHKRRGTWLSASPQGLSRIIEFCPTVELRGNLVIAQDWFNGNNFAHFLFDWITRVGHFLMAGQTERYHDLFLLGGVSSEFHERILEAFGREFGLKRSQFLFPNKGENIVVSGKTYWFSDQVRTHMHPGQMMCESSVSLLQRLGRALSIKPGNGKRIYISREDASGRRPINEQELLTILERHGFKKVVFGNLALPDQWSTMFGAEFIVSPHGMGLTSLALHPGCPKVIELFNPKAGSDAYACVAHAMGFPYKYILGDTTPYPANDFYVDPRLLEQSLDDWGV